MLHPKAHLQIPKVLFVSLIDGHFLIDCLVGVEYTYIVYKDKQYLYNAHF